MDDEEKPELGPRRKRAVILVAVLLIIVVIIFVGFNSFYLAAYN
jgi:hypothetical protein